MLRLGLQGFHFFFKRASSQEERFVFCHANASKGRVRTQTWACVFWGG